MTSPQKAYSFTPPNVIPSSDYRSDWEAERNGLSGAYDMTDLFLGSILNGGAKLLPDEVVDTFDPDDLNPFWESIADNADAILTINQNLLAAIGFGWTMMFLLPIVGFFWCCCRCCGNCGSKRLPPQKGGSKVSQCLQSLLFVCLLVVSWLGLAWYLAGDIVLNNGMQLLGQDVDNGLHDVELYMNNTAKQVDHLSGYNFDELTVQFNAELGSVGDGFQEIADEILEDKGLTQLVGIVAIVSAIGRSFNDDSDALLESYNEVVDDSNALKVAVDNFKDPAITDQWNALDDGSQLCADIAAAGGSLPSCKEVRDQREGLFALPLQPIPNFPQLPSNLLGSLNQLDEDMQAANEALKNLDKNFQEDFAQPIVDKMEEVGVDIKESTDEILDSVTKLQLTDSGVGDDIDEFVDTYYPSYGFFLAALLTGSVMLLVLVLYLLGFCLGSCGSSGGSAKRSGARLLCIGTAIYLLCSFFFWLAAFILFVTGTALQEIGCNTLEHPETSQLVRMFDKVIDESVHEALDDEEGHFQDVTFGLVDLLDGLENDKAIYRLAHLDLVYNISELTNWMDDIDSVLKLIEDEVKVTLDTIVEEAALSKDEEKDIREAATFFDNLQDDFFKIIAGITIENIFQKDVLDKLQIQLEQIDEFKDNDNIKTLINMIKDDGGLSSKVNELEAQIDATKSQAATLQEEIKPDGSTMTQTVDTSLAIAKELEDYMRTEGIKRTMDTLDAGIDRLVLLIQSYVDYGMDFVENDLGRTLPLWHVYQGFLKTGCFKLLDPFNAIWSGFGLLLLITVPLAIVGCCLETRFKRLARRTSADEDEEYFAAPVNPRSRDMSHRNNYKIDNKSQMKSQVLGNPVMMMSTEYPGIEDEASGVGRRGRQQQQQLPQHVQYNPADYFPGYVGRPQYEVPPVYKPGRKQ